MIGMTGRGRCWDMNVRYLVWGDAVVPRAVGRGCVERELYDQGGRLWIEEPEDGRRE